MPVTLPIRISKGKGAQARKAIRAMEDNLTAAGDMPYRDAFGIVQRLPAATATDRFIGNAGGIPAWTTVPKVSFASQADMEAATASDLAVAPSTVLFNPGIAKAWAFFSTVSATGLLAGSNVSSVSRTSAGNYTINFTTPFSSTNYGFDTNCDQSVAGAPGRIFTGKNATGPNGMLASSFDMLCVGSGGAAADPNFMTAFFYGDQ